MTELNKVPEAQYTWNLEDIFPNQEAWESAYTQVQSEIDSYAQREGTVRMDPEGAILASSRIGQDFLPVAEYAYLMLESNNADENAQALTERVRTLGARFAAASSFLEPELLEMSEAELRALGEKAEMADFSEMLRLLIHHKKHMLSKQEEHLLAIMEPVLDGPESTYNMLSNVDMKFPDMTMPDGSTEELTEGNFSGYRIHPDRSVRKQAFEHIFGTYGRYGTTIASVFGTSVKKDNIIAAARHYDSALQAAMEPLEIPTVVYDQLISVIHDSLPLLDRYLAIRRQRMGLDELHMYDLYVPMVNSAHMSLSFDEAFEMVVDGLAPMGRDYTDILRTARAQRWMDVYPRHGKSSGAFSMGALASVHPFVLLNHNDNLDCAFTIAHELGHSMHSYYSNRNQPHPKRQYSLFVAEVASTCNEAVMMRHLLQRYDDPKIKAYLLNHFLEQFRTTCFRQTMFAEFEKAVHEMDARGEPLTRESMNRVYLDLNRLYYGRECHVDDWIACEWMRIPHFYRAYYVYVYATGLCAAVTLSRKILLEGENAVRQYREFLSAGCSLPPVEALKLAGVDMSRPEPLQAAMQVFRETLDSFEELTRI